MKKGRTSAGRRIAWVIAAAIFIFAAPTARLFAQQITEIIGPANATKGLDGPAGVAVDSAGNVYVTGGDNVFKITPGGTITRIIDSTGDGTNGLRGASGVAVDSADNVYVTGSGSDNAFKIAPDGTITQIIDHAGDPTKLLFNDPVAIAVDGADNVYVTGAQSNNAFKIASDGTITQIIDATGDRTNRLDGPAGVAVDSAGNVYVAGSCWGNGMYYTYGCVFKIAPSGFITQIIDHGTDGLYGPGAVAVDSADNVYVTGQYSNNAFKITPDGMITKIIVFTSGLILSTGVGVDSAANSALIRAG